jgi:ABC-type transport system involved in multi-copper enzyme maturation permease subunit
MSLGPVFYVEMLTVGRRRRYVFTRVLYGLLLLFLMGICYLNVFNHWNRPLLQQQAEFAYTFFIAFSWVQLLGVLFMTPAMTAGTIAGEHERRTIDYLLTTSLTDVEITLGKFTARMLAIAAQLAVGVPILSIAMMLGGIMPELLLKSFLISLATLLSVGGMCLGLSARARTSREAIVRAYVILVALMIVPPILWGIFAMSNIVTGRDVCRLLTQLNPVVFLPATLFDKGSMVVEFPYFIAAHLGATAVFAASSVFSLRRFYVQQAGKAPPKVKENKEKPSKRWALVPAYSMLWKELVAGRGAIRLGWLGRIAAFCLYALALWGLGAVIWDQFDRVGFRDREAPHVYGMFAVPMIASLCLLLVAGRSAGCITSEREQDTWTTLISTPLTGREIVWAKFCAAIYSVRWWYYVIAAAWFLCLVITPEFIWAVPLLALSHLSMLCLTAAIGVLCSLNSTTSLRAMGLALAIVVLVLSIAPLFFAAVTRSGSLIAFSLPVLLGSVHLVLWEATRSSMSRFAGNLAAIATGASIVYSVAAVICYAAAVANFDALIGRTTGLSDARPGDDAESAGSDESAKSEGETAKSEGESLPAEPAAEPQQGA